MFLHILKSRFYTSIRNQSKTYALCSMDPHQTQGRHLTPFAWETGTVSYPRDIIQKTYWILNKECLSC
ncbi:hypothetical protein I7I48_07464 [Histoplasma ohiense]|nr:hypothetical protein I7I48_07464 [Histoplasma ohiense (nom. inval.)]